MCSLSRDIHHVLYLVVTLMNVPVDINVSQFLEPLMANIYDPSSSPC